MRSIHMTLFAGLACAACGSNNNHHADAPQGDASSVDGSVDAVIDAMPAATLSGTLAVTDLTVLDPAAATVGGIRGGAISFAFNDLTQGGGTVVAGTTSIGSCLVTKYDPTHPPNPSLDVGPIMVTNVPDASNNDGLLKTVGPCTFQAALNRYICSSDSKNASGTLVATDLPNNPPTQPAGLIAYTFPADPAIATDKLVGSYLVVNGFLTPGFNSGTGAFPVVSQVTSNGTLVVFNAAGEGHPTETVAGTASYTVLNGFNPVPAAGAAAAFLGTGGVKISTNGGGSGTWPAMDATIPHVAGSGWALTDPGNPSALPLTGAGQNIVFGCGSNTAMCGQAGAGAQLTAMIISGTATNKSVTGLAPFEMPTEVPGTDTWLSFTCAGVLSPSVTLTAVAHQAILDFHPTRVEVRVLNVAGAVQQDPNHTQNQANVLAGFGFVGHTDGP